MHHSSAPICCAWLHIACGTSLSAQIATRPLRKIPAFSNAICSRVSPRYSVWSMSTLAITAQSLSNTFTASSLPPSPTSRIATSTLLCDETLHRGQRAEFEVGQGNVTAHLFDLLKRRAQLRIARLLFRDAHPLVVVQQMRRGVAADTVSGGMQDGFQHRAHRPLAVGAADHDDRKIRLQIQPLFDLRHALQAERDGFGVQGFEVGQPVGQCVRHISIGYHGKVGKASSDATTSHSTNLSKDDSQVAGYAHAVRKSARAQRRAHPTPLRSPPPPIAWSAA